jgi:hypothetical protein
MHLGEMLACCVALSFNSKKYRPAERLRRRKAANKRK